MKKSQMQYRYLVIISIVLVGGLIIAGVVLPILREIHKSSGVEACRLSVAAATVAKKLTTGFKTINLKCPRNEIVFDDEAEYEIYQKIADEMVDCIYKMGKGELDFGAQGSFFTKQSCLICSEFTFKGDAIEVMKKAHTPKKKFPIYQWMKTNKIPTINKNYWDYFNSYNIWYMTGKGVLTVIPPTQINPDKKYIIVFKRYTNSMFDSFANFVKGATGLEWGFETENLDWKSQVELSGIEFVEFGGAAGASALSECSILLN